MACTWVVDAWLCGLPGPSPRFNACCKSASTVDRTFPNTASTFGSDSRRTRAFHVHSGSQRILNVHRFLSND